MDINSHIASYALGLIVILLFLGGYLLLLRVLKIPRSVRSLTLDQARRRDYLDIALISLTAGALWFVAWATALFSALWIVFPILGITSLMRSGTLDQVRQRVYLNPAIVSLIAGALWFVTWTTAQFIGIWGIASLSLRIASLSLGVAFLIRGLRWKAGETP